MGSPPIRHSPPRQPPPPVPAGKPLQPTAIPPILARKAFHPGVRSHPHFGQHPPLWIFHLPPLNWRRPLRHLTKEVSFRSRARVQGPIHRAFFITSGWPSIPLWPWRAHQIDIPPEPQSDLDNVEFGHCKCHAWPKPLWVTSILHGRQIITAWQKFPRRCDPWCSVAQQQWNGCYIWWISHYIQDHRRHSGFLFLCRTITWICHAAIHWAHWPTCSNAVLVIWYVFAFSTSSAIFVGVGGTT